MDIKEYNILLAPSSAHFKQTMVVLLSAILNCKLPCHFYIMESDWTDEQRRKILEFIKSYKENRLEFIKVDNSAFNIFPAWHGYHNTYYKILAHEYLPIDIERVLYLDTDTIVYKDIYKFYSMEFEDNCLIASNEHPGKKRFDELKYTDSPGHGFINAGVLLINLNKIRSMHITIDTYSDAVKNAVGYLADQGILSFVFRDKIKVLPSFKYNHTLFNEGDDYGNSYSYSQIFSMTKEDRREKLCYVYWDEDIDFEDNETIIHFAGYVNKPWDLNFETNKDGEYVPVITFLKHNIEYRTAERLYIKWWEVARKLPIQYYDEILKESFETAIASPIRSRLTFVSNACNFFEALGYDNISNFKFIRFFRELKAREKTISILKNGDMAGKYTLEFAKSNNINIKFSTGKPLLSMLTPEEWNQCKKADIIIDCNVHSVQPIIPPERDGVKPIMIWDILKDNSLATTVYCQTQSFLKPISTASTPKKTFNIIGCCVSRDTLEKLTHVSQSEVKQYVAFVSPLAATSKKGESFISDKDLEQYNAVNFKKRCFILDYNKEVFDYLFTYDSDYIVIDILSCRAPMYEKNGHYFSVAWEYKPFIDKLITENGYREVNPYTDITEEQWNRSIDIISDKILSKYKLNQIIIMDFYGVKNTVDMTNGNVFELDLSNMGYWEQMDQFNPIAAKLVARLKRNLYGCHVVPFPLSSTVYVDLHHQWGAVPLHYWQPYYDYAVNVLKVIMEELPSQIEIDKINQLKNIYESNSQNHITRAILHGLQNQLSSHIENVIQNNERVSNELSNLKNEYTKIQEQFNALQSNTLNS